ncbi:SENP2 protease, partial [Heliornis fulica]|nr:SENP2 protease [Heliornis fulica]
LFQAMEKEIDDARGKGKPEDIMSSGFNQKVTRDDLRTLGHGCWLNDKVINFYLTLVMERSKKESYPTVHAFSTFFYLKLCSGGYNAVKRWTRRVDLFKQDIILIPINLRAHWTLTVIDIRKKTIRYLDSMGQDGNKICLTLLKYLQEESLAKRNVELVASQWTCYSMKAHEIPQQTNGNDCGVFLCKFAEYISRDQPTTFTQSHMPYFRRRMAWEILHQQLL